MRAEKGPKIEFNDVDIAPKLQVTFNVKIPFSSGEIYFQR